MLINKTFFSIVIPVFNKELSMIQTLSSILSQPYDNYEVIIVDDGSTDNSVGIIQDFNDPRISVVKQTNKGVSAARNLGIKESTGNYIYFLDADDTMLSNTLTDFNKLINTYSHIKVFTANFSICDDKGKKLYCKKDSEEIIKNPFKALYKRLIFLRTGNIVIHRDCFKEAGNFNENLHKYEDLELIFRLIEKYQIAYTPVDVFTYHRNFSSLSSKQQNLEREFLSYISFRRKTFYQKLILGEHIAVNIQNKVLNDKNYEDAFKLYIKFKSNFIYIVLAYALVIYKKLMQKISTHQ